MNFVSCVLPCLLMGEKYFSIQFKRNSSAKVLYQITLSQYIQESTLLVFLRHFLLHHVHKTSQEVARSTNPEVLLIPKECWFEFLLCRQILYHRLLQIKKVFKVWQSIDNVSFLGFILKVQEFFCSIFQLPYFRAPPRLLIPIEIEIGGQNTCLGWAVFPFKLYGWVALFFCFLSQRISLLLKRRPGIYLYNNFELV